MDLQSQASVSAPEAGPVAEASGSAIMQDSLATLITVVSTLAARMDAQQQQLNQMQGGIQPAAVPLQPLALFPSVLRFYNHVHGRRYQDLLLSRIWLLYEMTPLLWLMPAI
jgi:hypothetical protein